ncbi:hypothetical protein SAMN05216464_110196 [Mucilaginibacter pineti]|uniref:Uncharacterized protein n=1 Tax=Mucilaginibacter pineti TaxID=1391627 RepID=A0A1G7GL61_9SPHI|nr:hypothetical protein [Mucilaginibacter pineti]SDE88834.1 hypothetical protein SAMN05216464_110196 [Mucilaginibacter pineti]
MTGIEHTQLRGITIKNMIVTIVSTAGIVISVMTSYFALKSDISEVKSNTETTTRVNEVRLKMLESQVALLQQEVNQLKEIKK